MTVVYVVEESSAYTGPWTAVSGSPFSTTADIVSGLSSNTSYYFRITARDTVLGISASPTVVGPVVTTAAAIGESPQNTRLTTSYAQTVPPPVGLSSTGSTGSTLGVAWSPPSAVYDANLNAWSIYTGGGTAQVDRNGGAQTTTSSVTSVVYWNHTVWYAAGIANQLGINPGWWYFSGDAVGGYWIPFGGDPASTASPQQTYVSDTIGVVVDASEATWQLNASGQVVHSGVAISGTYAIGILYWNSAIYVLNGSSQWFLWGGSAFTAAAGDPRTSTSLGQSPSGTYVNNTTWVIVDATGASWMLNSSGQVVRSGTADTTTSSVIELLYYQSAVYQVATVPATPTATPGVGSIKDSAGNTYTIDSSGNMTENGSDINGGSGTGEIASINGTIWAQDQSSGTWYIWNGSTFTQQSSSPPITTTTSIAWSYWNNGAWTSTSGDPRLVGASNPNNAVFYDDFTTLSLYNDQAPVSGTKWQPAYWYSPVDMGTTVNSVWITNPFNTATPFTNIYTVSNSILSIRLDNAPSGYASAINNDQFVSGILQTASTFQNAVQGYWEAQCAVPDTPGSMFAWWLQDNSGAQQIDILEAWQNTTGSPQVGKFSLWAPSSGSIVGYWYPAGNNQGNVTLTQMHQYGVEITSAGAVNYYVDRVQQYSTTLPSGYTNKMFMILQYGSGGSLTVSTPNPGALPVFAQVAYAGYWNSRPF